MANLVTNIPDPKEKNFQLNLNWKSNLAAKRLLDVIDSILAEEYIEIAKQNFGIFTE